MACKKKSAGCFEFPTFLVLTNDRVGPDHQHGLLIELVYVISHLTQKLPLAQFFSCAGFFSIVLFSIWREIWPQRLWHVLLDPKLSDTQFSFWPNISTKFELKQYFACPRVASPSLLSSTTWFSSLMTFLMWLPSTWNSFKTHTLICTHPTLRIFRSFLRYSRC